MKTLVGMRFDSLEKLKEQIEKVANKRVRAIIESESERDEAMDYMIDFEFEVGNIYIIENSLIYDIIDKLPGRFVTFDDTVVKSMVTRVKILSQEKIEVTLFDAVTLTVNI